MKTIGTVIFTAIEILGLVVWLALVGQDQAILGLVILAVLLIVEHIVTDNVIHSRKFLNLQVPILQIATFSIIETAIWAVWLFIADGFNLFLAAGFLFIGLFFEHTVSDNVFKRKGIFEKIFDKRVIGFTVIEVVGAAVWLSFARAGEVVLAIVILFIFSLAEHIIAVRVGQKQ